MQEGQHYWTDEDLDLLEKKNSYNNKEDLIKAWNHLCSKNAREAQKARVDCADSEFVLGLETEFQLETSMDDPEPEDNNEDYTDAVEEYNEITPVKT